ncbi:MAG TPA: glycoside hydrolase family 38 C-terminal domain-containing protein [Candidatus Hydrogenedens sp.]|nr:glycoside hydrolase family 38 C-terminal domain-containing protein [Candidatus Hydrogenedens sp.]
MTVNRKTIHLIGHAHIDPVWLWRWTEGYTEVRSTFQSVINLMKEYPEFKFTSSSSCFYEWIETTEPELLQEIKKRVEEGRWEITGAFYVEPDCNIPSGESFVRHGLYSQRLFQRLFNKKPKVAFAPDSFGHAGTLPQILSKLGIKYYVYMRPSPGREKEYPEGITFQWVAPDNSYVIASVIPESYGGEYEEVFKKIENIEKYTYWNKNQQEFLCFFGVCNHGGGPTRITLENIKNKQKQIKEYKLKFSTLEEYFNRIIKNLKNIPTMKDELQHHARGCYSALSEIKKLNRHLEHKILMAERFATAGWLLKEAKYPESVFEAIWKDLLFNQFHDILAGTSIKEAYQDARDQLGAARHRADVIINQTMQKIVKSINTQGKGNAIVVVNPLAWPVKQPVIISEIVSRGISKENGGIELVNDEQTCCPVQAIQSSRPGSKKYVFIAEIPSMGYRVYFARQECEEHKEIHKLKIRPHNVPHPPNIDKNHLENDFWSIGFDCIRGGISRLYDKTNKIDVIKNLGLPIPLVDASDTWSHDVSEYRVEAGKFNLADMKIKENGEVLASMVQEFQYNRSRIIQEVVLYKDIEDIDVYLNILWLEEYKALKWFVETNIFNGIAAYEVPYGVQVRPCNGEEEVGQQWIDLSGNIDGKPYGLSVITDSNYGYDTKNNIIRVTLLRSPAYAHHDPERYTASNNYPIIDQGWQEMRIRLIPHTGTWKDTRVVKSAWEFNVPLIAQYEHSHPGKRGLQATLLGTEAENILISVVKKSEEGKDLIIRAYETYGKETLTNLHLTFLQLMYPLKFTPYEIKTVKININTKEIFETNLLEEVDDGKD